MTIIRNHLKNYDWSTVSGFILIGFAIGLSTYGYWLTNGWLDWRTIFTDFYANISAEAGSIAVTVIIIDRINRFRDTQSLKKRLIGEAGSQSNETAKSAVDWMRREGWLEGDNGLLQGANLARANLKGAYLSGANLDGANLFDISLDGANLREASLNAAFLAGACLNSSDLFTASFNGANLEGASLDGTYLFDANLEGAYLSRTSLDGASLQGANLDGANLSGAKLNGVDLRWANVDNVIWQGKDLFGYIFTTTLPDGTEWASDTDMTRFTNPAHPNFWHPPERES